MVLIDVRDLRAGEVWDQRLQELIEQADIFQSFWSSQSMHSPFCRREWEHALMVSRPDFIRPVYWEAPLPRDDDQGLPPPTLARLHFACLAIEPYAAQPAAPPPFAAQPAAPTTYAAPPGGAMVAFPDFVLGGTRELTPRVSRRVEPAAAPLSATAAPSRGSEERGLRATKPEVPAPFVAAAPVAQGTEQDLRVTGAGWDSWQERDLRVTGAGCGGPVPRCAPVTRSGGRKGIGSHLTVPSAYVHWNGSPSLAMEGHGWRIFRCRPTGLRLLEALLESHRGTRFSSELDATGSQFEIVVAHPTAQLAMSCSSNDSQDPDCMVGELSRCCMFGCSMALT